MTIVLYLQLQPFEILNSFTLYIMKNLNSTLIQSLDYYHFFKMEYLSVTR